MAAIKLSEKPFNPVTNHCLSYLCADRYTKPVFSFIVGFADNDKMGGVNPLAAS